MVGTMCGLIYLYLEGVDAGVVGGGMGGCGGSCVGRVLN